MATRARLRDTLDDAARFFGVTWPPEAEGQPITVVLVPIPGKPETTRAASAGAIVLVELTDREDDLAERYGVIAHELCHSLWRARSDARSRQIDAWFEGAPRALALLDEALATVLGNVLAAERAGARPAEDDRWYDDPDIDAFARAILPLVRRTVEARCPLDAKFADEAKRLLPAAPIPRR
jgi:hypothetical protein